MKLSNQPARGTSDWLPSEFKIRKYIMDTWRRVCVSFGYQEYLTPIIEKAEIYKAKSGEDIGGKELMVFQDRVERELAIRPEMTPSVTRMVSKIYKETQKPIRYFSIANFWRNEKPQKGRNREFWQLNYDCFGSISEKSDIEIIQIAIEIMLAFSAPKNSFQVCINDRNLIDAFLGQVLKIKDNQKIAIIRLMDKWEKLKKEDIAKQAKILKLTKSQIGQINQFMQCKTCDEVREKFPVLDTSEFNNINEVLRILEELGYGGYIQFKPNIIRGFDYYNGIVFEVFDADAKNQRSLFGGGRYNGLGKLFGGQDIPAVGCAPGDETMRLFLANWGLLDQITKKQEEKYYLPILSQDLEIKTLQLAQILRSQGQIVEVGLTPQKINKALDYANKKSFFKLVILGEKEAKAKKPVYKIKDMQTGKDEVMEFVEDLRILK